jgi:hypothetical protein
MSDHDINPSFQRLRSALDHRGIAVATRLLVAGIWLERQFGNVPNTLAAKSRTSGPTSKVSRVSLFTPRQNLSGRR